MSEKEFPYEDIVNLPHHTSPVHAKMSMANRAAQFAPFKALTGYEKVLEEARHRYDEEGGSEYRVE
ncbi:MAG: hypothetical protein K5840_06575 [Eubacterium sp.]|nr:hypothetical protein [Eubacterium sp.]